MKIFYIFAFALTGVLGEFCIKTSSNLCFYIGEQGPMESRIWDLTFQFIYGDGEATSNLEFPEQVGRCMNVKSSVLNAGTWNVTNLNYTLPRPSWTLHRKLVCEIVYPKLCFAIENNLHLKLGYSRVQFMRNAIPKRGPHDGRIENFCQDVSKTLVCFSEQPLLHKKGNGS